MNANQWRKDEVERCHRLIEGKIIEAANMEAELNAIVATTPDMEEIPSPFRNYIERFWNGIDPRDIERALVRMMCTDLGEASPQLVACVTRVITALTAGLEKGGSN